MIAWLRSLVARIAAQFQSRRMDERLREEMRLHAELLVEKNLARGLSPEEARREARLALGSADVVYEAHLDARGFRVVDELRQDVRYACRGMRRNRGFTAVAVFTLAIAIGASTALFTVVNSLLLRPLPYRESERLVMLFEKQRDFKVTALQPDRKGLSSTSLPGLQDWRSQTDLFEDVGAYAWSSSRYVLTGAGEPEEIPGCVTTANLFPMLGVPPMLGRSFLPGEDRPGANDKVILAHELWARRFGSDPHVLGRSIVLNGRSYTIVGVMLPGFEFPRREQLWVPYGLETDPAQQSRGRRNLETIARLRPGVSIERARASLETMAAARARDFPASNGRMTAAVVPLREYVLGDTGGRVLLLFGATGFLVLIGCANLANMLLARGVVRAREMAMRTALGAGWLRLLRQALVEAALLAAFGAAAGLTVAAWGTRALVTLGAATVPALRNVSADGRVLLFAFAASLVVAALAGIVPAVRAARTDVNAVLKQGRSASGTAASGRVGGALVVVELALALLLLAGAGLMITTLARLSTVDVGFNPNDLLTARITLPAYKYDSPVGKGENVRALAFYNQALERVRSLPGVREAAFIDALPFSGVQWGTILSLEARPGQEFPTHTRVATPSYFRTMNIPLLRGRPFTERESAGGNGVVIINDILAAQLWPSEDPIGRRLNWNGTREVVGVVRQVRQLRADLPGGPEMYVPLGQQTPRQMFVVVRTVSPVAGLEAAIRTQVRAVDPSQPIEDVRTMNERIASFAAPRRFYTLLLCAFAAIAVTLAAIGIYGIISYSVSQRRQEIGIRVALGANRRTVFRAVLGRGLALAISGAGLGAAGALVLTRILSGLLYGVQPTDPSTFATVSLLLVLVALAASYVPARRASRIDPIVTLRAE